MSACPLCEHVQPDGDVCDVCGRPLGRSAGAVAPEPPLDGLEPTAFGDAGTPDTTPLEGLEPTVLDASAGVGPPPEAFPEIEPTRAPAVDVAVEPVPDLEPTAAVPSDAPTPLAAFATCRYCRAPASPGERRCARCGMRLPVELASREASAEEEDEALTSRLCSCGAPVTGAICRACGARIPDSPGG